MAECDALIAWAEALPPARPIPSATSAEIERHLEFLAATLPSKNVDDDSGKRRFAVYTSVLCEYPNDALAYMARQVVRTLDWFPTPKQCIDILAQYRRSESERSETLRICGRFATDAMRQWLDNVRAGQPLGDVPDDWLRIGVEQGIVRRLEDGSYVSRARFIGPTMAGKIAIAIPARRAETLGSVHG